MYSTGHIFFIVISLILIAFGVYMVKTRKPPIRKLLKMALLISVCLEVIKVFAIIRVVPVVELAVENGRIVYHQTGAFTPYMQGEHMPLDLCSLQIIFFFFALRAKSDKWKKIIYSAIYGTAIIGGVLAIFLSSIAPDYSTAGAFLLSPRAWEFFFYHVLIIVVAIAIAMDKECDLHFRDLKWMAVVTVALDFFSFYLNSIMSVPYYQGDELMGIGYAVNYFSTYNNPLGITMSNKEQYFIYLFIRIALAAVIIPLVYLPFLRRDKKREQETQK